MSTDKDTAESGSVGRHNLKAGAIYVVKRTADCAFYHEFEDGDEIVLYDDDGTEEPEFRRISDNMTEFVPLSQLAVSQHGDTLQSRLALRQRPNAELVASLEKLIRLVDMAFDYDGDVFGFMHNQATDDWQEAAALVAREKRTAS